jgi:hypothetical protein
MRVLLSGACVGQATDEEILAEVMVMRKRAAKKLLLEEEGGKEALTGGQEAEGGDWPRVGARSLINLGQTLSRRTGPVRRTDGQSLG